MKRIVILLEGQPYVIEGQLTGLPGKGIMEVHNAWDGWTR